MVCVAAVWVWICLATEYVAVVSSADAAHAGLIQGKSS